MKMQIQNDTLEIINLTFTNTKELLNALYISKKKQNQWLQYIRFQNQNLVSHIELQPNDILYINIPYKQNRRFKHTYKPLQIAYEDDLFLIVNKPPFLLIHSDGTIDKPTLNDAVESYCASIGYHHHVLALHRLDYETSGLVIYCKCEMLFPYLSKLLETKQIQRFYYAIVEGIVKEKKIVIKQAIGRDRHNAKKMRISSTGKYAHTVVYRKKHTQKQTLLECELFTGRTHQIRVHCAFLQHPIVNDALYGKKNNPKSRCLLHAYKIRIPHPFTKKYMEVCCKIPSDMNCF